MKDFFKMVFATMVGILLFGIIMGLIGMMCLVGIVASGSSVKSVDKNSVMVLNLSGSLDERSSENVFNQVMGFSSGSSQISLEDALNAIRKAKDNEDIKGIYSEAGLFSYVSYASLKAIRRALEDFRKSGK